VRVGGIAVPARDMRVTHLFLSPHTKRERTLTALSTRAWLGAPCYHAAIYRPWDAGTALSQEGFCPMLRLSSTARLNPSSE
jgi:hypothetical protein